MKLKIALLALLAGVSTALAEIVVSASELPKTAQTFISTHFKGVGVGLVKKDMSRFEVLLQDGTRLGFNINGEWVRVGSKYKPIPTSFVPSAVLSKLGAAQGGASVSAVHRELDGYKFRLDNGTRLFVDNNGNVTQSKRDKMGKHRGQRQGFKQGFGGQDFGGGAQGFKNGSQERSRG